MEAKDLDVKSKTYINAELFALISNNWTLRPANVDRDPFMWFLTRGQICILVTVIWKLLDTFFLLSSNKGLIFVVGSLYCVLRVLQVRAAYKRALLSFHPDRASGSDIRQLVEAEEKFKLISRMKDKLLMTY